MHLVLPVPMDLGQIDTAQEKEASRFQRCILLFVKVEQWLDACSIVIGTEATSGILRGHIQESPTWFVITAIHVL